MSRTHGLGLFRRPLRSLLATAAVVVAGCSAPAAPPRETVGTSSQAETTDTFGLGSGRTGSLTVSAAATVVNTYAPITATTATTITVGAQQGAPGAFAPGDLLMVWRATGLTAVAGSQSPFSLTADVGTYEFARVKSFAAGVITVTNPLGSATRYATGSQVVRVPEYTSLTINSGASVVPYAWDGSSGGVVIVFATVGVTSAGAVSADGAGFRGGGRENGPGTTGCTAPNASDEATPACGGAHKGEGLSPTGYAPAGSPGAAPSTTYGYDNDANGGGGGESRAAGGGGGGGFQALASGAGGTGGTGGNTADGNRAFGGLGGAPVSYDPTTPHVAFGGGGGAGDEWRSAGTSGVGGGGVVIVRAGSIGGTGSFTAKGASQTVAAGADGSGGGGGGGAVILLAAGALNCATVSANGGTGGSGGTDPDGPGGGGGGGLVFLQGASGTCNPTVDFGPSGTTSAPVGGTYNAQPGQVGKFSSGFAYGGGGCTAQKIGGNLCGGCVSDADCPTSQVCDTAKNTCGPCTAANQGTCSGVTSACSTSGTKDSCVACDGDFGATSAAPCLSSTMPRCVTSGLGKGTCGNCLTSADCATSAAPACSVTNNQCSVCNGDQGTTATAACPTGASPYCQTAGTCGRCTSDTDCAGNHAGPRCDTATGSCGNTCSTDAICGPGEWCDNVGDAGTPVCQAKVANSLPVPGGACTATLGARACASGACDAKDNLCGVANGDACSAGDAGGGACRSGVCVATGGNAGKCEPCTADSSCSGATPACSATTNQCVACTATNAATCSGATPLCDTAKSACVGCNGDLGTKHSEDCASASAPVCFASGSCGKCTVNSDCSGAAHAGRVCDLSTGACGDTCTTSSECGSGLWCSASAGGTGTCKSQLVNGTPLPSSPASLSKCTAAVGQEVCASGVCNTQNNTCGLSADAGVPDAGKRPPPSFDGSVITGVSIEGGALSCEVRRGPAPAGGSSACFIGLALAGAALARRRR